MCILVVFFGTDDFVENKFCAIGNHYCNLSKFHGMTLWKGKIVMYGTGYDCYKLYCYKHWTIGQYH